MIGWLFDATSDGGGGGPRRPVAANDVSELRRYLRWLAVVILLGLCTMCGVVALAWSTYG
jgi:hypothetical protein